MLYLCGSHSTPTCMTVYRRTTLAFARLPLVTHVDADELAKQPAASPGGTRRPPQQSLPDQCVLQIQLSGYGAPF